MKNLGIILVISLLLIAGCSSKTNSNANTNTAAAVISGNTPVITSSDSGSSTQNNIKEFNVVAKQWEFIPKVITVKKGDTVRLNLKSIDVTHGFKLDEYNINKRLDSGQEATVEFIADKAGEFTFFCNVPCGEGHKEMTGTLIVE